MSEFYLNPNHEDDPNRTPDAEVYRGAETDADDTIQAEYFRQNPGWYWHLIMPDGLSSSAPIGPFKTEIDAIVDARVRAGGEVKGA